MIIQVYMKDHARNVSLIERNNGKLMRFADLPITAQNAMIHYMSVDGAAWAVQENWPDWKWGEGTPYEAKLRREMLADIEKFRPRFVERWDDVRFGYMEVPTKELIDCVMQDQDFSGDADYYTAAKKPGFDADWEYDAPTWPVILSPFPEETFQDGWTRFYRYCEIGAETVPCLWYCD